MVGEQYLIYTLWVVGIIAFLAGAISPPIVPFSGPVRAVLAIGGILLVLVGSLIKRRPGDVSLAGN